MKKYTNMTHEMLCVEFKDEAQFLTRGQSVTNDFETVNVPKGILVEDLTPKVDVSVESKKSVKTEDMSTKVDVSVESKKSVKTKK